MYFPSKTWECAYSKTILINKPEFPTRLLLTSYTYLLRGKTILYELYFLIFTFKSPHSMRDTLTVVGQCSQEKVLGQQIGPLKFCHLSCKLFKNQSLLVYKSIATKIIVEIPSFCIIIYSLTII